MNNFLNENNINKAENLVNALINDNTNVIRVKSDKGLIERTTHDAKKVVLVEDNRQVICD